MSAEITGLVPQETIDKVKELQGALRDLVDEYSDTARELAKGLEVNVKVVGDIDKLDQMLITKAREATSTQQQLSRVMEEQQKVIANTTNTISRQLMEQEKVNKTQREAYNEHDKVKRLLDQFHDTYQGQTQRLVQLNTELKKNKENQKSLEDAYKTGRVSQEQYTDAQARLIAQQRAYQQEKRALSQLMTAEEKAMQAGEGSYAHMAQQLELLKKAYKSLGEEGRNSDFGKELEASIQNLDAHLKDMAADMGEFQRNVGNYAVATGGLQKEYDGLVGTLATLQSAYSKLSDEEKNAAEGQKLAKQIEEVTEAAKGLKQSLDEQSQAVANAKATLEGTTEAHSTVKKDLKELVLEIANLTIEYQNLTAEEQNSAEGQALAAKIAELTERAGKLKDVISDTNQAIANAASDTRGLDQLSGSLQLAVSGFGLATGAASIFGISSQNLAQIQTKLQAAIAASNALTKIQNALQKQSAVMQGVNLVQTKLRTVAENLHTAAQGKGLIATKLLTAAQWAFNAAASANPIGLLITAIVAATAAVYGLVKAFSYFFGPSDEEIAKFDELKKKYEELTEANDRLIERMKNRGATEAELMNATLKFKQQEADAAIDYFNQAKKLYDEDEDNYKEALERKNSAYKAYIDYQDSCIDYIKRMYHDAIEDEKKKRLGLYEYKRQLLQAEMKHQQEILRNLLLQGKLLVNQYVYYLKMLGIANQLKLKHINEEEKDSKTPKAPKTPKSSKSPKTPKSGGVSNAANDLKTEVQKAEDAIVDLIEDSVKKQIEQENIAYERRKIEIEKKLKATGKKQVQMREALNSQLESLETSHQKKIEQLQNDQKVRQLKARVSLMDAQIAAAEEWSSEEEHLVLNQMQYMLHIEEQELEKSADFLILNEEEKQKARNALYDKFEKEYTNKAEEYAAKRAEIVEKEYAHKQNTLNNDHIKSLNALKTQMAEELALAKGNQKKQEEIREKYAIKEAELSEQYAKETAQNNIDMLKKILEDQELSIEDRISYKEELAKAEIALETAIADETIAQIERVVDADNKAREKRAANMQQWLNVASEACNNITALFNAIYENKLQKIEDEEKANEEESESELARIERLVTQKVITEEEGEARKRALEEETAKKEAEIAKKKAALQRKQAIFDKANSVAQAAIATALSLIQLWASPGWPAAIPMMAVVGALGAAQIATILATPIPKYAKGTDAHKGGLAIVGDGGRPEVVSFGNSAWITPDTPTLVDIPKGASVYPSVRDFDLASTLTAPNYAAEFNFKAYDDTRMRNGLTELISVIKRQSKQQHRDAYLNRYEQFKRTI